MRRGVPFANLFECLMVVALFALSLVLIVSGVAAVVQGFPYVRLESGLAMVIGGTTAASAGTVLLGLAAVVLQLQRSTQVVTALFGTNPEQVNGGQDAYATAVHAESRGGPTFADAPPVAPAMRPGIATAAGLTGAALPAVALAEAVESASVTISDSDRLRSKDPDPEVEPPLPDLLPPVEVPPIAAAPLPEPPPGPVPAEADLFIDADLPEHPELRPALDDASVDEGPSVPKPETELQETELQVVGTYSSGGNTYVMFSNGTIEAETPRGRFTFNSLDELKQFVDTGGENCRGAA